MKENGEYTFRMVKSDELPALKLLLVECCGCFVGIYGNHGLWLRCPEETEAKNIVADLFHNGGNDRLPIAYGIFSKKGEMLACSLLFESDYWKDAVVLGYVYVKPEHRRKGLGTKLVQGALREAGRRFRDCKVVFNVVDSNAAAKAMYRKLGLLDKPVDRWYDITDGAKRFALEDRPL